MRQVSENELYAYISEYDYYIECNDELKIKNAPLDEYLDIKQNGTDRLLGRISEFFINHELKYVYEIQEEKTMAEIIIKKERHECPPAVAAYVKELDKYNKELLSDIAKKLEEIAELKSENARLEEGYQKSVGVIAADPIGCNACRCTYKDVLRNCAKCRKAVRKAMFGGADNETEDAETVKHAYWEEKQDMNGDTYYHCTNCKEDFVFVEGTPKDNLYYRCPNCGAKMDLKDGESE